MHESNSPADNAELFRVIKEAGYWLKKALVKAEPWRRDLGSAWSAANFYVSRLPYSEAMLWARNALNAFEAVASALDVDEAMETFNAQPPALEAWAVAALSDTDAPPKLPLVVMAAFRAGAAFSDSLTGGRDDVFVVRRRPQIRGGPALAA